MPNNIFQKPGDYQILDMTIIGHDGSMFRIEDYMLGMNIYEDLFSNYTTGTLTLKDPAGLLEALPIIGEEKLSISFSTSTELGFKTYIKVFDVYKVADINRDRKTQYYTLHFASQIMQQNLQGNLSRSFSGKSHEIVHGIYTAYLSQKEKFTIEESKHSRELIAPNVKALDFINYLSDTTVRGASSDNTESSYLFYEDRDGFNFVTLEGLLSIGAAEVLEMQKENIDELQMNVVGDFYVPQLFNQALNMKAGVFANSVVTHDIINKKLDAYAYQYDGSLKQKYEYSVGNKFQFLSSNYDYKDSDGWGRGSEAFKQQMKSFSLVSEIPGNSNLTVGDMVEFKIPTQQFGIHDQLHVTYPTTFLITKVKHTFTQEEYRMTLDITSDQWSVN